MDNIGIEKVLQIRKADAIMIRYVETVLERNTRSVDMNAERDGEKTGQDNVCNVRSVSDGEVDPSELLASLFVAELG